MSETAVSFNEELAFSRKAPIVYRSTFLVPGVFQVKFLPSFPA